MRVTASVPARINIIGEHTDHFGGLSLTFSSQHRLELTASPRDDRSRGDQTVTSLWEVAGGWSADLDVDSNIPIGAGLSSSAALCVAIVMCSQNSVDPMEISLEAQRIENHVLRSNCGLMDQISVTHSKTRQGGERKGQSRTVQRCKGTGHYPKRIPCIDKRQYSCQHTGNRQHGQGDTKHCRSIGG